MLVHRIAEPGERHPEAGVHERFELREEGLVRRDDLADVAEEALRVVRRHDPARRVPVGGRSGGGDGGGGRAERLGVADVEDLDAPDVVALRLEQLVHARAQLVHVPRALPVQQHSPISFSSSRCWTTAAARGVDDDIDGSPIAQPQPVVHAANRHVRVELEQPRVPRRLHSRDAAPAPAARHRGPGRRGAAPPRRRRRRGARGRGGGATTTTSTCCCCCCCCSGRRGGAEDHARCPARAPTTVSERAPAARARASRAPEPEAHAEAAPCRRARRVRRHRGASLAAAAAAAARRGHRAGIGGGGLGVVVVGGGVDARAEPGEERGGGDGVLAEDREGLVLVLARRGGARRLAPRRAGVCCTCGCARIVQIRLRLGLVRAPVRLEHHVVEMTLRLRVAAAAAAPAPAAARHCACTR